MDSRRVCGRMLCVSLVVIAALSLHPRVEARPLTLFTSGGPHPRAADHGGPPRKSAHRDGSPSHATTHGGPPRAVDANTEQPSWSPSAETSRFGHSGMASSTATAADRLGLMAQRLLEPDSPVYSLITSLYLEAGNAVPFSSRPWTHAQAVFLLGEIPKETLSAAGKRAVSHIENLLEPAVLHRESDTPTTRLPLLPPEHFLFNLGVQAALESYLKHTEDTEWLYDYNDRTPAFLLDFDFSVVNWFHMEGVLDLRQDRYAAAKDNTWLNLFPNFDYIDAQMPFRAYGAVGGRHWNLQVGRENMAMGPGRSGNLTVSTEPDYLDLIRFSTWWRHFAYTGAIVYIEPWLTAEESEWSSKIDEYSKYMMIHRFDVNFHLLIDVNICLTEGYMWGGKYPDLRFLNPVNIFHNFYDWEWASSMFSAEIELNPWRFLNLYAQMMWNQIQLGYEKERYPGSDAIPPAMGWMLGGEGRIPLGPGYLVGGAEYVYTDPWLYIRENPLISYHWRMRAMSNFVSGRNIVTKPIGYRYGNDSEVLAFWLEYDVAGLLRGGADVHIVHDGIMEVDDPYQKGPEAVLMTAPHGTEEQPAEHSVITDIFFYSTPFPFLEASTHLFFLHSDNYRHVPDQQQFDVQWICTIVFKLNTHSW